MEDLDLVLADQEGLGREALGDRNESLLRSLITIRMAGWIKQSVLKLAQKRNQVAASVAPVVVEGQAGLEAQVECEVREAQVALAEHGLLPNPA